MNAIESMNSLLEGMHVLRPKDPIEDRRFRAMIHDARCNGILIINVGDGEGYYKADMNNPEDAAAVHKHLRAMKSRIRREAESVRAMVRTVKNTNQMSIEDI